MKDLTKGSPAKVIWMFAIPLMFGSIFQQFYNLADSKIVSTYVGTTAFAAVGATSVVSNTIISFINGLTQGFAIPVANSFGAKDYKKMRRYVADTFILTAAVAVTLMTFGMIFIEDILKLLNTPDNLMDNALSYVRIILIGVLFTALYNMCASLLRAVGDSKTPLYCLMAAVVINIGLDLLFVKVFDWKIHGAAYATIISQAISGFLCLGAILVKFKEILPKKESFRPEKGEYSNIISTGAAMGFMSCIVNIGTIVLQGAINSLGTDIVAAHTAARKIFDITCVALYCVGLAMTTYVSQNMGAKKYDRVINGVKQSMLISWAITTIILVICFIFAKPLIIWISSTSESAIINPAVRYIKIGTVFYYVLGPLFILRCSLQGMGRKIIPILSSVLEMFIKVISASIMVPIFKYTGVIFTEPISWVVMVIVLAIGFVAKKPEMIKQD